MSEFQETGYGDGGQEYYDDGYGEAGYDEGSGLDQTLAQLQQQVAYRDQREDALEQREAELDDAQLDVEAAQLEEAYPDLADDEVAGHVVGLAEQYAQAMGRPELMNDLGFVEQVYLSWVADGGDYELGLDRAIEGRVQHQSFFSS